MGAQLVKEAASKTADVAGDGTTTATVLARAIVAEGIKMITANANPMVMRRGLLKASEYVVQELKGLSKKITLSDAANVATISAGDVDLGNLIADALKRVGGKDGVVTVEEGKASLLQLITRKECSLIKALRLLTLQLILTRWSPKLKIHTFSSQIKKSRQLQTFFPFWKSL